MDSAQCNAHNAHGARARARALSPRATRSRSRAETRRPRGDANRNAALPFARSSPIASHNARLALSLLTLKTRYLALLPTRTESGAPLYADEDALARWLAPSDVAGAAKAYRARVFRHYDRFKSARALLSEFLPARALEWPAYVWATQTLDSRAIWCAARARAEG